MNSEYIYLDCEYALRALNHRSGGRRFAEAFAVGLYIKGISGTSAIKPRDFQHLYNRLNLGRVRQGRILDDIVRFHIGRREKNGTIVIRQLKNYKKDCYIIKREKFIQCMSLFDVITIIREAVLLQHFKKQMTYSYFIRLQKSMNLNDVKKSERRLRRSVDKSRTFDFLSYSSISKLTRCSKEHAISLTHNLQRLGMIEIKKGKVTPMDNIDFLKDKPQSFFDDQRKKGIIYWVGKYGNVFESTTNRYTLTNRDCIVRYRKYHLCKITNYTNSYLYYDNTTTISPSGGDSCK